MPTVLQFRRGTTSQNNAFTGTLGELSVDTTLDTLRIHDGSTAGGFAITQNTAVQTLTNKTLTSPALTTPTVTTAITLNAQGDVRFADADSSNYVAFQAPATVASNVTWTLPDADASVSGYALTSNASGVLSWAAAGTSTTISQDNSTNTAFNIYYNSTTSGSLTALKYDGADMTFNPSTSTFTCTNITGTSSAAKYADLAEIYETDCELEAGDVVMLGGEKEVTLCDNEELAFGVVSTAPGFLLNCDAKGQPIALKGRVPVNCVGTAKKGQRIVLSEQNGKAKAVTNINGLNPFFVIGRALEDKETTEEAKLVIVLS